MDPWRYHIEHANESPFTYITNIADRNMVVDRFVNTIMQARDTKKGYVSINVGGWIDWHGTWGAESLLEGVQWPY